MKLTATPLRPGELAGLAEALDVANLPNADLADPGHLFFRFKADGFIGYGGLQGGGRTACSARSSFSPIAADMALGRRWLPPSNNRPDTSGCSACIF